jgi:hypothetical protein
VRARAAALLGSLLGSAKSQSSPELPPLANANPDGGTHDAGTSRAATEPTASDSGGEDSAAPGGRDHLVVETPPGVHFQIDRGPYQTATKAALPLAAGPHLITAISGVQEVIVKADATVTIHIEASQAEQLFRDGRDNFNKPDYAKAKRQLEKASALCARDKKHAQACAGLTLESSYLLGQIYVDQNALPEAMTAFQRVSERAVNVRGKNEQKAYAEDAIKKLQPKLGQVIVTQKGKKGCQKEVNWLRPGEVDLRLNGTLQSVTVKAGEITNVGSCN